MHMQQETKDLKLKLTELKQDNEELGVKHQQLMEENGKLR